MAKLIFPTLLGMLVVASAKYNGPINQAGIDLIKHFEGFRPNFYGDPVKIRTIGYGHACHALPCSVPIYGKYSVPLSQSSAEALLREDLTRGGYESCVQNAITYSGLTANQYSALVSFTFNLGCGSLRRSTLRTKLNNGDVSGAAGEFQRWVNAGGRQMRGLVLRRAAEKKLFCNGANCGGSGGGSGSSSCTGSVTANSLNIRSGPYTSSSIVGSYSRGTSAQITSRSTGTSVYGNPYWFKVPSGYISAYWVNISSNNGASWCSKN